MLPIPVTPICSSSDGPEMTYGKAADQLQRAWQARGSEHYRQLQERLEILDAAEFDSSAQGALELSC